jgi:hypothetical protein
MEQQDYTAMTDDQLIDEVKSLHDSIYNHDCYSSNDIRRYEAVMLELRERGYEVKQNSYLDIEKDEGGDE